jgi:hypothetical protein
VPLGAALRERSLDAEDENATGLQRSASGARPMTASGARPMTA